MDVDAPKRDLAGPFLNRLTGFWRPLRNLSAARSHINRPRSLLTAAEFQEELAILGLSGRRFEPEDYSDALGEYLDISITVHVIPDSWYPELSRLLALSGRLGELRYSERLNLAAIFVPGSLPPLVLTLTILHELGHLAAGDLLIEPPGRRRPADRARRAVRGRPACRTDHLRNPSAQEVEEASARIPICQRVAPGARGESEGFVCSLRRLPG
jgi:hypothetical protein